MRTEILLYVVRWMFVLWNVTYALSQFSLFVYKISLGRSYTIHALAEPCGAVSRIARPQ